ncbi:MAG: hypothetical protein K2N84_03340 [Clostridia bacterium]|nr:hypothetical protein [Clostridia bacterium]
MKKQIAIALAAIMGTALFAVGCGEEHEDDPKIPVYTVYAPDGAPALGLVNAIASGDSAYDFKYNVVASGVIQAQVTGATPAADFCVLPVNLASKLLGTGETYKMLGTVTHGNFFLLTTGDNETVTAQTASSLAGKTVGVVQLTNVPGLTFQAALSDLGIEYQTISNLEAEKATDKVNLLQMGTDATNVTPAYGCDYYLCPEPAVTAKIKGTASTAKPFKPAGSLQEIYGGENGFPQAVLVAKSSILQNDKAAAEKMISYFAGNAQYLANASAAKVLELLDGVRTAGLAPAFNDKNLNETVIANCSVRFVPSTECKAEVNTFLAKLASVNADSVSAVADAFYYMG